MQPNRSTSNNTLILYPREIAPQPDEVVRTVPIWASPPDLRRLVMLGDARPEATAALRVLRHRLEPLRADGMRTFGVTSAREREGKSTLAVQLALVLSEAQRSRVLLVEGNMQHPSLANLLGFQVPQGLAFSAQIARRLQGSPDPWAVLALGPALHVLAESTEEGGYPEVMQGLGFREAIERLGRLYDWVVVDAPSVLGTGDANVVEEMVDGIIVVARSRVSHGADVRAAVKQLGERKTVGLVLWDAHVKSTKTRRS